MLTPQQQKGRAALRASAPVPVQTKKPTTHQVYSKKKGLIVTPSAVTSPVKPPKGVFTNPTTGEQTDAQGNTITGYNQYGVAETDSNTETQDDNRSIQDRAKSYLEGQYQGNADTAADLGLPEDTPYYTSFQQETRDQIDAQKAQRAQQEASYNYQQQASEYQTGQAKNYLESQSQAQAAQLAGGGNGPTSLSNIDLAGKIKSFNQQKIDQAIAAQNDTKAQLDQARANLKLAEKQGNTALIQRYQQELDNAQMAVEQADTDYYNSLTSASEEQRKQQDQQATNLNTFADLVGNGVTLDSQTIMSMAQQFGLPSDMLQAYYDGADNIRNDKTLDAQTKQVQLDQLKQNLSDQVAGLNTEAAKNLDTYKRLVQSGADPDTIAAFKQLAGITDYNDPFTIAKLNKEKAETAYTQSQTAENYQNMLTAQAEYEDLYGGNSYIPQEGGYPVQQTTSADGSPAIRVGVTDGQSLDIPGTARREDWCGAFVNDTLGTHFGDLYTDKVAMINSSMPAPGMAFVEDTSDQYGHVGIVESVDWTNKMMTVVEANWQKGEDKKGIVSRRTIPISDAVGFVKPENSAPTSGNQYSYDSYLAQAGNIGLKGKDAKDWAKDMATQAYTGFKNTDQSASYTAYNKMAPEEEAYDATIEGMSDQELQDYADKNGYISSKLMAYDPDTKLTASLINEYVADPTQRQLILQQARWVGAKLRKESGAAISVGEYLTEGQEFWPQSGDDAQTIKDKESARKNIVKGLYDTMGPYGQRLIDESTKSIGGSYTSDWSTFTPVQEELDGIN